MNVSVILLAIAALCFLLAAFNVNLGEIALIPLGLLFLAVALIVDRTGAGRLRS